MPRALKGFVLTIEEFRRHIQQLRMELKKKSKTSGSGGAKPKENGSMGASGTPSRAFEVLNRCLYRVSSAVKGV